METKDTNPPVSAASCQANDWASGGMGRWLWLLPIVALIVGASWVSARAWLWIPAFLIMSVACLANAARCGRVHCYFTGPLFLLAAVYVALAEFHLLPMNPNMLLATVLFLTLLSYAAEFPLGRYRKRT